jgi:glycosyltransferase involved in cell wall biosynthesis
MSRIAVVTSSPPMVEGGHMTIARALVQALRAEGHQAEVVVTPQNPFGRQASAYIATWLTDLTASGLDRIDQVISLRYPSYAVRHPQHVCWLNHTMREYYDLWDRFERTLSPRGRFKERLRRRAMHAADRYLLTHNVKRLFVQSRTVQQRLAMWPELRSEVVYPPAPHRAYRCDGYEDYIFMVSRLTTLKRADLLLRALATPRGAGIRAVIAGDGEERGPLMTLARELGLDGRVTLTGGLSEAQLLDHLARCRAVCFPPLGEDYGFVTVEAFSSSKAVITCRDSGGPAELVEPQVSGFICDPTPESLADALAAVMADRSLAESLGTGARKTASRLTWPGVVSKLTAVE